jgi:hypothetical protein
VGYEGVWGVVRGQGEGWLDRLVERAEEAGTMPENDK